MYFSRRGKLETDVGAALSKDQSWREVHVPLAFDGELHMARGWEVPIPNSRLTLHCPKQGILADGYASEAIKGLCLVSGFGLSIGSEICSVAIAGTLQVDPMMTRMVAEEALHQNDRPRVFHLLKALDDAGLCYSTFGLLALRSIFAIDATELFSEDSRLFPTSSRSVMTQRFHENRNASPKRDIG